MPGPLMAPPPSLESDAFYAAAAQGRLLVPRCATCGKAHWYPRALCPFCFDPARLEPASGRGHLYSVSVMRRAEPAFAIAYVTLEEGPAMLTHIVDCDLDTLRIGTQVRVVFKPAANGVAVACFTPSRP